MILATLVAVLVPLVCFGLMGPERSAAPRRRESSPDYGPALSVINFEDAGRNVSRMTVGFVPESK